MSGGGGRSYVLPGSADRDPVLVWANMSKSSWAPAGLALVRELRVLLTLSAPTSGPAPRRNQAKQQGGRR